MDRNTLFHGAMVSQNITLEFAQEDKGVEFKGEIYRPTDTLAYVTFIMCHTLPTLNSHHFGVTAKTMAASFPSAVNQLLNIRHILAANDSKGRLSEDRIVGHIVDVHLPFEEWQTNGMLTADLSPTDQMTDGMPLYALGRLHKRAKGVNTITAEQEKNGELWAMSVEMQFPWAEAGFLVNGQIIAAKDAPDDLFEGVRASWDEGTLPKYRYNGQPVYLIGGFDNGEVSIVGCALTTYPADSGADILDMAASFGDPGSESLPREALPDAAFVYVEATGEIEDGKTIPDTARHYPIWKADSSLDLDVLQGAITTCMLAEAATDVLSTVELRMKLITALTPLAAEHFPDSDFVSQYGKAQAKGGENSMDLVELLQTLKASLDEFTTTDGFKTFKEANGKVAAAQNALYAVMNKAEEMVFSMAEAKAVTLAEESVKAGFVTKEAHDKAITDVQAESEKAVEAAKVTWAEEQAEKDAKAKVTAGRIDKLREEKVEKIPATLQAVLDDMATDEDGVKAFDAMIGTLQARRKACEDAKIVLSEAIDTQIILTLADDDEVFKANLELWQSLTKGTLQASLDKGKGPSFTQKTGDDKESMDGAC